MIFNSHLHTDDVDFRNTMWDIWKTNVPQFKDKFREALTEAEHDPDELIQRVLQHHSNEAFRNWWKEDK